MRARASGDMVKRFVSNSDLCGCSVARVIAIVVSQVGCHFPNIGYFEVYVGI